MKKEEITLLCLDIRHMGHDKTRPITLNLVIEHLPTGMIYDLDGITYNNEIIGIDGCIRIRTSDIRNKLWRKGKSYYMEDIRTWHREDKEIGQQFLLSLLEIDGIRQIILHIFNTFNKTKEYLGGVHG